MIRRQKMSSKNRTKPTLNPLRFDKKNRTSNLHKLSVTALILLLSVSMLAMMPIINATNYTSSYPSYSYIDVEPKLVGVGQTLTVAYWLADAPPTPFRYEGITIVITKPDNSTEKISTGQTDTVGAGYIQYTPKTTGTYTFKAVFPGQEINITTSAFSLPAGLYYFEPSESSTRSATVQEDKVQSSPETPLPSDYWTNPISAENRAWSQISGDWLSAQSMPGSSNFNYYTTAPDSAHIMWTKSLTLGGIADASLGWGEAYYTGIPYEEPFSPPVIISGRLYYNEFSSGMGSAPLTGVVCVDIRTGQEIWRNDSMPQISRGQVFNFDGDSHHGSSAYLWSVGAANWQVFDAFSGRQLATLVNTTSQTGAYGAISAGSGTFAYGPNGELLMYILDAQNDRLTMWNSTLVFYSSASDWRIYGTYDWTKGIQWSVTIPHVTGQTLSMLDYNTGVIVAESTVASPTFTHIGYSTETGERLWIQNRTGYDYGFGGPDIPGLLTNYAPCHTLADGVYVFFYKQTEQFVAFDAKTGNYLWTTDSLTEYTNSDYTSYDWSPKIAYGTLYVTGFTGSVSAFNLTTGEHIWTFNQPSSGFDTPYGSWNCIDGVMIADNKVYVPCMEHTPTPPMYKGYKISCLDAETGDFLWTQNGLFTAVAVSNGYFIGVNGYDQQIYCFGKGSSAITVDAPSVGVTTSTPITISGTITDISSGTSQDRIAKNFPNGLPCVSDDSESEWMAYVYQQQSMPTNVTGVPVELSVIDSNGNYRQIGTTTSDASGTFAFTWTPDISGNYTLIANFPDSNSYYSSTAETHFYASEPATPAPTTTTLQPGDNTMIIVGSTIAVVIAIAIVGAVILMSIKKRP